MSASFDIEQAGVLRGHMLPPGISPTGSWILDHGDGIAIAAPRFDKDAADTLLAHLRDAADRLRLVSMVERIEALGAAGERLGTRGDPLRAEALRLLPVHACLSPAAATGVLDSMAADWTRARLGALVEREFGDAPPELRFGPAGEDPDGAQVHRIAVASRLALTICSGTVPGVSVTAVIRSLLVGSGTLLKPGAGDAVFPMVFAAALQQEAPELASALAVVYWPGGDSLLEDRALAAADRIVVYGGDDTLRSVRSRASTRARLVEYRHRVGVAVVGVDGRHGPRSDAELDALAEQVTDAVVPYEQRGCVSPVRVHAIGTQEEVARFGAGLAHTLERRASTVPGSRTPSESAAAHQLMGSLELRRAAGEAIEIWAGEGWTVAVESSGEMSTGGRVVLVTGASEVADLREHFARLVGRLQVVGVAGLTPSEERQVALFGAASGASRIGPLDQMAYPPAWWVHEGMGPLRTLTDGSEWVREG